MAPRAGGLSNGTLSLKFMQRAQMNANETPVEATRAKLLNDSEWELPAAGNARTRSLNTDRSEVSYEASYLPFLFDRPTGSGGDRGLDSAPDGPHPGRRRLFMNGKEKTIREMEPPTDQPTEPEASSSVPQPPSRSTISQSGPAPRAISRSVQRKMQELSTPTPYPAPPPPPPPSSAFMRPPVDEPSPSTAQKESYARPPVDAPRGKLPSLPKSSREALGDLIAGARRAAAAHPRPAIGPSWQETQSVALPGEASKKRVRTDSEPGDGAAAKIKKKKKKKADVNTPVAG